MGADSAPAQEPRVLLQLGVHGQSMVPDAMVGLLVLLMLLLLLLLLHGHSTLGVSCALLSTCAAAGLPAGLAVSSLRKPQSLNTRHAIAETGVRTQCACAGTLTADSVTALSGLGTTVR